MQTFTGWEKLEVAGATGSEKNGDAEYFSYETPIPSMEVVAKAEEAFPLEGKRLLRHAYGALKISNRPNPKGKPRKMRGDEVLAYTVARMAYYTDEGLDVSETIKRARADTSRAMADAATSVQVKKISKTDAEELDKLEREMLKRLE